ncbi:hypothetical protein [Streptomyces tubercidicus]
MPIVAAGKKAVKVAPNATFKVYPGAPHGLMAVGSYKDDFHADLLEFLKS